MKRVLTFGTFDIYHPGHEYYLKEAKKLGEKLIVIIARDETVKRIKNKEPQNDEKTRFDVINALPFVDEVKLGNFGDKFRVLSEVTPHIIVLGYDQESFTENLTEEIKRRGLKSKIVRFTQAFEPEKYKSSLLRKK